MTDGCRTVVVVVSALTALWSADASACSCAAPGPPCQAAWSADAVFVGTVRGIEEVPHATYSTLRVTFDVERGFVNAVPGPLEIRTPGYGQSCGYPFRLGQRYVVYARTGAGGQLTTGICSRTRPAEEAADDLNYLLNLPPPSAGVRVFGRITQWERHPAEPHAVDHGPVEGIVVNVRTAASSVDVRTNRHGRYEVPGLSTGAVVLSVLAPPGFDDRHLVREFELEVERGCSQHDFQLRSSARASGLVADASGRPVAGVHVDAVAAELAAHQPPPYHERARTDATGRFAFDHLPPGTYVFGVNLTRDHPDRSRGTPVLLPGTTDVRAAGVFDLAPGDVLDTGVLRLPIP
jgi:hypothetical protein